MDNNDFKMLGSRSIVVSRRVYSARCYCSLRNHSVFPSNDTICRFRFQQILSFDMRRREFLFLIETTQRTVLQSPLSLKTELFECPL